MELIGQGRTADVFAWEDGQVIKLFHDWFSPEAIEHELNTARAVQEVVTVAPRVFDLVEVNGQRGIVYERLDGPTMESVLRARPWSAIHCGRVMADLHAAMHQGTTTTLPSFHDKINYRVSHRDEFSGSEKAAILARLAHLPEGSTVCHGDLHPLNILMTARGAVAIDWMDASRGSPTADVARTLLILGNAVCWAKNTRDRIAIWGIVRLFAAAYRQRYVALTGAARGTIRAWRLPLAAARVAENIPQEQNRLLAMVRAELDPAQAA